MPGELFAILRNGDTRRIPLRQNVQEIVSDALEESAGRLLREDLEIIPLSNAIYSPDIGQEAWAIKPFVLPRQLEDALRETRTLPELSARDIESLAVRAIGIRFQERSNGPWLALQAVDRRQVIRPGGLSIILDGTVFRRLEEPGLQLGADVHAVYRDGGLLFDQIFWVKRVVDIAEHYRQATDRDVQEFAARDDVYLEDEDAFRASADEWVRRRIALIADSNVLASCAPREIRDKARDHQLEVRLVNRNGREVIAFPSDKRGLKDLLRFLGEDIFKGPLTNTPFVSNSKRRR